MLQWEESPAKSPVVQQYFPVDKQSVTEPTARDRNVGAPTVESRTRTGPSSKPLVQTPAQTPVCGNTDRCECSSRRSVPVDAPVVRESPGKGQPAFVPTRQIRDVAAPAVESPSRFFPSAETQGQSPAQTPVVALVVAVNASVARALEETSLAQDSPEVD